MYATMPKYVIRLIGEDASPGWYANVNPLIVFVLVNFITSFMKKRTAITSMTIGMLIIPLSALVMAGGTLVGTDYIMGLHPVAFMMIVGIAMQAVAECFIRHVFLSISRCIAQKARRALSRIQSSAFFLFLSVCVWLSGFCSKNIFLIPWFCIARSLCISHAKCPLHLVCICRNRSGIGCGPCLFTAM